MSSSSQDGGGGSGSTITIPANPATNSSSSSLMSMMMSGAARDKQNNTSPSKADSGASPFISIGAWSTPFNNNNNNTMTSSADDGSASPIKRSSPITVRKETAPMLTPKRNANAGSTLAPPPPKSGGKGKPKGKAGHWKMDQPAKLNQAQMQKGFSIETNLNHTFDEVSEPILTHHCSSPLKSPLHHEEEISDFYETISSAEELSDGISSGDESTSIPKVPSNEDLVALSSSHPSVQVINLSTTINLNSFTVTHLVGKGGFGKVHQVIKNDSKKVYALKTLKKNHIIKKNSVQNTISEKDILKRIKHPFIVKLHYAFQDAQKLYLVMDFVNGGQLFYHLKKELMFKESQARFYLAELILGLEHLHELGICHRDLKPENILLDSEGHIVLTDFGLAKEEIGEDELTPCKSFCGTLEYMAPEIITRNGYGKAVDIWSVGILMYDMLVGHPPFTNKNNATLQDMILKEKPKIPKFVSPHGQNLIANLLQKDPKKRLTIQKIKKHGFFKGLEWHKLERREIAPPFIPTVADAHDITNFDITDLQSRVSLSTSPVLSSSQQAYFDGFSFVRSPNFGSLSIAKCHKINNNNTNNVPTVIDNTMTTPTLPTSSPSTIIPIVL
ncbi:putative protein serine/threonine kinase [Cavenderia fasciculata]|uniref:non-specific serine/threonine protein kinase n=1 Tax=Cavenderia fasciculata TaxID=261658 RepID=F4Q3M4_CACFS|nr:putative protein serine/threonine kinase [Cavenderia fasciculata]EGG17682.1 putative protein serine/threonine kinase [Cavenderia fasciculata]|eukprot:XP_004356166.1 putative protein serine/threonine kinase [Cavenderia fasciculata]